MWFLFVFSRQWQQLCLTWMEQKLLVLLVKKNDVCRERKRRSGKRLHNNKPKRSIRFVLWKQSIGTKRLTFQRGHLLRGGKLWAWLIVFECESLKENVCVCFRLCSRMWKTAYVVEPGVSETRKTLLNQKTSSPKTNPVVSRVKTAYLWRHTLLSALT